MSKFIKLFDTPNGQLVVMVLPENGNTKLTLIGEPINDTALTLGFEYQGEEGAERAQQIFNGYDQLKANDEASKLRAMAVAVMKDEIK